MLLAGEEKMNDYHSFLELIFVQLEELGIDVDDFELDHICYRLESVGRYEALKAKLSKQHKLIHESLVNGRMISIFSLSTPIVYKKRQIRVLELPAPKAKSFYTESFEHVEFVVGASLEEFLLKYPSIGFDRKGLQKEINREVRIKLGALSVKFHEMSLTKVIEIEQANQSEGV